MQPRIPGLGRYGHRCRGEVLHLLQAEVQLPGDDGQFCHILFVAARMAGNEIGNKLLAESRFAVNAVEQVFEGLEQSERRFAHHVEYAGRGVFRCHLQPATHMARDEFAGVVGSGTVYVGMRAVVQQEVIAHATANEGTLDAGQCVNGVVEFEQWTMVGV